MKFKILTLRFEHGASGMSLDKAAEELVEAANAFSLMAVMNLNGMGDMFALAGENPKVVLQRWRELYVKKEPVSERSTMYTCEFCGAGSSKELWGPGRITCPLCKKVARAADGTDRNLPRDQQ